MCLFDVFWVIDDHVEQTCECSAVKTHQHRHRAHKNSGQGNLPDKDRQEDQTAFARVEVMSFDEYNRYSFEQEVNASINKARRSQSG